MHMADALLSPAVGGAFWVASGATLAWSARRVRERADDRLVPLMGVLGAFVFAAQMINFTIPATGSSGHIGGGLLLSVLLGPHAAFVVIASVLTVQALFFADGGLLALGANVFNLGVGPCFLAYPLIWRTLAGPGSSDRRLSFATVLAAMLGLQLGALGVVLQTWASGISSLPFTSFLGLMLPIHLAIGAVEGAATAALLVFIRRARPDLLQAARGSVPRRPLLPVLGALALAAALTGGVLSWFASTAPDGLEWSAARVAGGELTAPSDGVRGRLAQLQQRTAWLPGYDFATPAPGVGPGPAAEAWPQVRPGTSLAGIVGGACTLALVAATGWLVRRRRA